MDEPDTKQAKAFGRPGGEDRDAGRGPEGAAIGPAADAYATREATPDGRDAGPLPSTDPYATRSTASDDRDTEPSGFDPRVSFLAVRGRGAARAYLKPEGATKARASFAPGVILQGRYELGKELGRGGMGVVHLGRDIRLGRPVAIKAILSEVVGRSSEVHREAFAEEARLGANLTHPAIATVYDYGFHEGSPFAVFEFIPGLTLRDVLRRRGKLPLDEARLIVGALAQALDFAHERHVVHRDLKPENIRATEQGLFKVLDLGLAKDFHRHDDWTFCGTPAYASPEQAGSQPCDGRTDQYALAVIAFEMLVGRRPFESQSWTTLLDMHAKEPPPRARSQRPDVPDSVDEALDKALSKDPNRRFATCTEFAAAIGCQLLSAPAPAAEILLEATCRKMTGRWKSFTSPFSFGLAPPRIHLALAPDALWATYRGMVMRWPLATIAEAGRRGRWLRLRLDVAGGKSEQWFRLPRREECQAWLDRLEGLIPARPGDEAGRHSTGWAWTPPEPLEGPRPDPVVLLKSRPSTRFQLLGPVDVKVPRGGLARPSLAIRGLMMGADAIVNVQDERLAGAYRTEFRASGMAVRAVDREGRLELKARWFEDQTRWVRVGLIAIASFDLFGGLLVIALAAGLLPFAPPATSFGPLPLVDSLGAIWVFALTVAFGWLRWPQFARPVSISFFAMAGSWIVSVVVLVAVAIASRSLSGGSIMLVITLMGAAVSFSIFSFYCYLASRSWAIGRDYRRLVEGDAHLVASSHRVLGRLALVVSIAYAAYEVGGAAWRAPGTFGTSIKQLKTTIQDILPQPRP